MMMMMMMIMMMMMMMMMMLGKKIVFGRYSFNGPGLFLPNKHHVNEIYLEALSYLRENTCNIKHFTQ